VQEISLEIRRVYYLSVTSQMPSRVPSVQECDATDDDSSNTDGLQIVVLVFLNKCMQSFQYRYWLNAGDAWSCNTCCFAMIGCTYTRRTW